MTRTFFGVGGSGTCRVARARVIGEGGFRMSYPVRLSMAVRSCESIRISALRSGLVRFFHPFGREPGPNRFYTFHEGTKNWTGPYRTGLLQLQAVTGPVLTSPELTLVLTSQRTGQDQLSTCYLLTTYS